MRCTACCRTSAIRGLDESRRSTTWSCHPSSTSGGCSDRELLDRFARHYKTGKPMPQSLVDRIEQSSKFNQGYATLEYLSAAIVDMDLHTRPDGVDDIAAFEREALARIGGMPREVAMRHRLPHFDHLFGNDMYSAGYYSYLWSDVMAADAWQAFVEAGGPWDAVANDRLRAHILSDGNSIDRAEAYRRFRGRDPEVRALFEARGFATAGPLRPLLPLIIDEHVAQVRDALSRRRAVVLCASPGAGKTTRIPPALVDAGPVILLQPRRVAARAVARRIAEERQWTLGREIGWQIRFERRFTRDTRLLVVTEGILTARLQQDPLLSAFATIILDEFHERSIHADLGLALARQAWLARDDLRIVVMSATLDVRPRSRLSRDAPVVRVPGALHPLTIEYGAGQSRRRCGAHVLPRTSGQVLCFLPGAREIDRARSESRESRPRRARDRSAPWFARRRCAGCGDLGIGQAAHHPGDEHRGNIVDRAGRVGRLSTLAR